MSIQALFEAYFRRLYDVHRQGDAREESFYSVLETLVSAVAEATGRKHIHVTTLPRPTDAGNPDFRVWNGADRVVGYIEAKRPTEEHLDGIEDSEQLQRYRSTFPNLILTNFCEFRLYRNGERIETVLAARPFVLTRLGAVPAPEKPEALFELLDRFLGFSLPKAFTAESLAVELAKRTRFFRGIVGRQLAEEEGNPGVLTGFFEAFKTYLISDLSKDDFADLFAQTITYGLFAARTRANGGFSRRAAFDNIPRTIGVLRDLFRFISLDDLPGQLAWCVDDIAAVLGAADVPGLLGRYYHGGTGGDPIVHFYETFLAQYDPAERERRGVYYTPEPVVDYIVRSLHGILKRDFGKTDGLASGDVTLLDPAAGTMTFIARAAQLAVAEFETKYGPGAREDFIRRHILRNFYAFELMMAPYAVGHLKMSFLLEELGHRLEDDERVPFYLTNTLDIEELQQSRLPGFSALARESRLAGAVKKQTPILVILGNPPYSGHSSNMGEWIRELIEEYKQVDGKPLGEKNPKWLQDDYVKFLRFAQWKIEQAGRGVVGMITNHAYLDNPTFRGMRRSLMQTFDEIYVLDLHGNSLKKETCPDGSPDRNVFDIRQGVAIAFFVKRRRCQGPGEDGPAAVVRHAEIWGTRRGKYAWLNAHRVENTEWREPAPHAPAYLFVPRDEALAAEYGRFPSLPELFPVHSVGIVSARDRLTIHWTAAEAWRAVNRFARMEPELARQGFRLGKDVQDWNVAAAQKDLLDSGPAKENVVPILYRPFDVRYTYFTGRSRGFLCRPRTEVMRHMLAGENLALVAPRRVEHAGAWQHAFVTTSISEHVAVSLKTIEYHFPLFLVSEYSGGKRAADALFTEEQLGLYEVAEAGPDGRRPNLTPKRMKALEKAYGGKPAPEEVFGYVYAVLYAPIYREKYAEFLRRDFPRVPFTSDAELFRQLAALGQRLVALHRLQSPELDPPAARFQGDGDGRVGKGRNAGVRYDPDPQRLYINPGQYFAPVPEAVWSYRIGGYQVCEKWLRDRRERRLELDEVRAYCRIVTAIARTIEVQGEIDALYPAAEQDALSFPE